jgi:serine beta-lactamase-like protein LACTB, mitochondrial
MSSIQGTTRHTRYNNQFALIIKYFIEKTSSLFVNDQSKSKGVSIAVTLHGDMIWKQGFGLADIEQRVACTSDTVMRIASISKTFTITLTGQQVDAGKLMWDDPIAKYRPDLPKFHFENTPVSITVRQLASHTR